MTPLRAKMIRDMQVQRLAPRTQEASVTAVAGIATFSHCSPDRLSSEPRLSASSPGRTPSGLEFLHPRGLWAQVLLYQHARLGSGPP